MSLHEATKVLRVSKVLSHEFEEKAVDMDIVLPDYCAAISAILKCTMRPVVTASFQSGDRYSVDGITTIRVLYMGEDRTTVHCHEVTQPFSVSFRSAGALHHTVEIKNDYVNCRATGPRRFDIHGAFRVCLEAVGVGECEVFCDPCQTNVFCRKSTVTCTIPLCEAEKSFVLDETIELGFCADRMLYTDLTLLSCDYKALNQKMIVKGIIGVRSVCIKNEETVSFTHEIPFSQIVDIDGLNDTWLCSVRVNIGESECGLQTDDRNGNALYVRTKMMCSVKCRCREQHDIVLDAYAVDYPLLCETMPFHALSYGEEVVSYVGMQETLTTPEAVTGLMDIWGELKSYERKSECTLACCLLVGMIGCNEDGQPGYYERTVDCEIVCEKECDDALVRLTKLEGVLSDGVLRIKGELEICGSHVTEHDIDVVVKAVCDTTHPYPKNTASIRIVHVDAGENLWDIAKLHRTNQMDIMAENELETDEIAVPTMLMIPVL